MSALKPIILFLILLINVISFGQVSFETVPTSVGGEVGICSGEQIEFSNTSVGLPVGSSYNWSFPGGSPNAQTGEGPHVVTYDNPGDYVAELNVDGDIYSVDIVVSDPSPPSLDLATTLWTIETEDGIEYITRCGTNTSPIAFTITTTNQTANSIHEIDWGNGNSTSLAGIQNGNLNTVYNSGNYTLTYIHDNGIGCSDTLEYNIFIGLSPNAGLEFSSSLVCIPGEFNYQLTNFGSNPVGTTYEVEFTDGSAPVSFSHPPQAFQSHTFEESSCGAGANNQFFGSLFVENVCGSSQIENFGPITVYESVDADFTVNPGLEVCEETNVTIQDNSTGGINITPDGCTNDYSFFWEISPSTGYTINNGSLGDDAGFIDFYDFWNNGSPILDITFNEPGEYDVTLTAGNSYDCGFDTITYTICVTPEVIADFDVNETVACAPFQLEVENNSSQSSCSDNLFEWSITRENPENCLLSGSPDFEFINGTDENTFEPDIVFNSPGNYTIRLENRLETPVAGVLCEDAFFEQVITIKETPHATLNPVTICQNEPTVFNANVNDCYGETPTTYNWQFGSAPPASVASSTDISPTVSYNQDGDFTYSLTVSNECGDFFVDESITIEPDAEVSINSTGGTCVNSTIDLEGVISGGTTSGTWSSSVGGTFLPSNTDLDVSFVPPSGFTGPITISLTSDIPNPSCPSVTETTIINIEESAIVEAGIYSPLCINTPLNLSGSFGGAATSITWSTNNGGSFSDVNDPNATFTPPLDFTGTIDLTITTNDPPGACSAQTATVSIQVVNLPVVVASTDQTICDGETIAVSATGATTYDWDQGVGAGQNPSVSPSVNTTYTVTGTDANGCQNTDQVTVSVNALPNVVASPDQTICADGDVQISATGANSYSWDQTIGSGDIHTVAPNSTTTYTVTGTDANNCQNTDQVTVFVNDLPNIDAGEDEILCIGSSITLEATGGATYSWNQGLGNGATHVVSPNTTTTYTVTGADANGCENTDQVTVQVVNLPVVVASTDQTICEGETIAISATGAATYDWDQGVGAGQNPSVSPSVNTTYTVTGTDGNGCQNTDQVIVSVNALPNVVASPDQTICADGDVQISATGANTYSWDQTIGSGDIHTVAPNSTTTYTVTGTDANNCQNTDQVTVFVNDLPNIDAGEDEILCIGSSITLEATGGTTYSWNQGLGNGATHVVSPNTTTTYTVTGANANGCENTDQVTVQVVNLPVVVASTDQTICDGETIAISATGAATYNWDQGVGAGQNPSVSPSVTTTYTVTGTDANGCQNTDQVTVSVNALPNVVASPDQTICADGDVQISATGANTYSWDQTIGSGDIHTVAPNSTTTYTVTGTDANNCQNTDQVTVFVNDLPNIDAGEDEILCIGSSITLEATGGTTYSWNQGLGNGATHVVSPNTTTTYTVTGANANGCENTDQVTVQVVNLPVVVASTDQTICDGETIAISATGAATYNWDQGVGAGQNPSVSPSVTTTYTVTGTDGNGCQNTDQVTVSVNALPNVVASPDQTICADGDVQISATGANTYSWDQTIGSGDIHTVAPNSTTTYTVTGTDANNCQNTDQVTVFVNDLPNIDAGEDEILCIGSSITLEATGGATYSWNQGLGNGATHVVSPNTTTTYTVTGADANGCENTDQVTVQVVNLPVVVASTDQTICDGETIAVSATGAATYNWDQGVGAGQNPSVSPSVTTTYTVTGTDANGCQNTDQVTVSVNALPNVVASPDQTICADGDVQISATGANTYSWDQTIGSGDIHTVAPNSTTTYTVTGTDANNCQNTDQVTVFVNDLPNIDAGEDEILCIGSSITLEATGGATYSWNQGLGNGATHVVSPNTTTTYTVTGADANGCENTDQVTVQVVNLPVVVASTDQTICDGETIAISATGAATYNWDQGVGAGQNPSVSPSVTTTYTVTGTDGNGCQNTDQVTVSINPLPIVDPVADVQICASEESSEIVFTSSLPGTIFNWTNSNTSIGLSSSNGIGNLPTFIGENNGTNTSQTTISVTPSAAGCLGSEMEFDIIVLPRPSITNSVNEETICSGTETSLVNWNNNLSTNGLSVDYNWEVNTNNANISGQILNGTGSLPQMTLVNNSTQNQDLVYSVTPIYESCEGVSFEYTITVTPAPIITSISAQEVCSGDAFNTTNFTSDVTNTDFSWELVTSPIPNEIDGYPSPNGTGNIVGSVITNDLENIFDLTYEVTPSFENCLGNSEEFTITVFPELSTFFSISDQTICDGETTEEVILSSNLSGMNLNWQVTALPPEISGVTQNNGTGVIPSFELTNTSDIAQEIVISAQAIHPNPNFCVGDLFEYRIVVNPTPIIDQPNDIFSCAGDNTGVIIFDGTGTTYSWINSNTDTGLSENGTNNIPDFELENNLNQQITSTVDVTPIFTNNAVSCLGSPVNFEIKVNPTGELNSITDIDVCNDEPVAQIPFISSLPASGMSYEWENSEPTIGLIANGVTPFTPPFTAVNNSDTTTISEVGILPIYTEEGLSCPGDSSYFNILVYPTPEIIALSDTLICNETLFNQVPEVTVSSNFEWFGNNNPAISGISLTPQTSSSISDELTNTSSTQEEVVYVVTPISNSGGCVGTSVDFSVFVQPDIVLTSTSDFEICSGTSIGLTLEANESSTYTWFATSNPNVSGATTSQQNGNFINDVLINQSGTPQLIVYTVIPTSIEGECEGAPQFVTVLVNPELELIIPLNYEICSESNTGINLSANGNATFTWFGGNNPSVNGVTTQVQSGGSINDFLVNTTLQDQTVTYNVVASSLDQGCTSQNNEITVTVHPRPILNSGDTSICSNSSVGLVLDSSSPSSFTWFAVPNPSVSGASLQIQNSTEINDILILNSPTPSIVDYIITPTSTPQGCIGEKDTVSVTVQPLPNVSFDLLSPTPICNSEEVSADNTSDSGLDFSWNTGDGNTYSSTDFIHTYEGFGTFEISLTGTNPLTGCSNSDSLDVDLLQTPIVNFGVNQTEGCVPQNLIFTDSSVANVNNIFWDFGDGETSTQTGSVNHTYIDTGCYTVSLFIEDVNGCSNSISIEDLVCIYPQPSASFIIDEPIQNLDDNLFQFTNFSTNSDSYIWDFGNGDTSNATNPYYSYTDESGVYLVTLIAMNEGGCSDTAFSTLQVKETELIYVANTITPNGDGVNDEFLPIITAGINEDTYQLLIYNRWGELLFETRDVDQSWDAKRIGKSVKDGVYVWKIRYQLKDDQEFKERTGHVTVLK